MEAKLIPLVIKLITFNLILVESVDFIKSEIGVEGQAINFTLQDGIYFKLINTDDEQVLSIEEDTISPGANATASVWKNLDSQMWLAVKTDADSGNYFLLPRRQHKLFSDFMATRKKEKSSFSLPSVTVLLGIDVLTGHITQQVFHGKSNQQWKFVNAKTRGEHEKPEILIESPTRGKCIAEQTQSSEKKNPMGFIQTTATKIKQLFGTISKKPENTDQKRILMPIQLVAVDCDNKDSHQRWRLAPISS